MEKKLTWKEIEKQYNQEWVKLDRLRLAGGDAISPGWHCPRACVGSQDILALGYEASTPRPRARPTRQLQKRVSHFRFG